MPVKVRVGNEGYRRSLLPHFKPEGCNGRAQRLLCQDGIGSTNAHLAVSSRAHKMLDFGCGVGSAAPTLPVGDRLPLKRGSPYLFYRG